MRELDYTRGDRLMVAADLLRDHGFEDEAKLLDAVMTPRRWYWPCGRQVRIGDRVLKNREVLTRWGLGHGYDSHVHVVTSMLSGHMPMVGIGAEQEHIEALIRHDCEECGTDGWATSAVLYPGPCTVCGRDRVRWSLLAPSREQSKRMEEDDR